MADPPRALDVNVSATADLLDLATDAGARVVFASSAAVYGDPRPSPSARRTRKTRGNHTASPNSLATTSFAATRDWKDLDTVALRLFNVYGPGQTGGVVPSFLEQVQRGEPLVVHGDGTQTRDFVHVDDVVRAMVAAARTDATGESFNVGTGDVTSIHELATVVRDAAPVTVDVVHDDPRPADVPEPGGHDQGTTRPRVRSPDDGRRRRPRARRARDRASVTPRSERPS